MSIQDIIQKINDDFFLYTSPIELEGYLKQNLIDINSVKEKKLTFSPASEQEIIEKEVELQVNLPPSYKEFLKISNGFKCISLFLDNLYPLNQIDWAKNTEDKSWLDLCLDNDLIISDEDYFDYGDEQDTAKCRDEYIPSSLKISNWYDGMCVFLNPLVKNGEEWEVLEYAVWHLGIRRYKSFADFLIKTHEMNEKLRNL